MRIVVSSEGSGLCAAASRIFGRCSTYVFVDTDTMAVESVPNPAQNAPGGAGIQAAQFVIAKGAEAVITGSLGPHADDVLGAAGVQAYLVGDTTVEGAVEDFIAGKLTQLAGASAAPHGGLGVGAAAPTCSREEEVSALAAEVADLRRRLAQIMARIDAMEEES